MSRMATNDEENGIEDCDNCAEDDVENGAEDVDDEDGVVNGGEKKQIGTTEGSYSADSQKSKTQFGETEGKNDKIFE